MKDNTDAAGPGHLGGHCHTPEEIKRPLWELAAPSITAKWGFKRQAPSVPT